MRDLATEVLAAWAELKKLNRGGPQPTFPLSKRGRRIRALEGKMLNAAPDLANAVMELLRALEEDGTERQADELAGARLLTSDCVEGRHDECDDEGSVEPTTVCGCPCHGHYGSMCRKCWRERTASMDSDPRSRLPKRVREHKGECKFCAGRIARARR